MRLLTLVLVGSACALKLPTTSLPARRGPHSPAHHRPTPVARTTPLLPQGAADGNDGGDGSGDVLRARLRQEAEAPVQVLRLAAYVVSGAGAVASGAIAATQLAAGTLPVAQAGLNLGVDVVVVAGATLLWNNEQEKRAKRLARVTRGAELSALKVRGNFGLDTTQTAPLAAFRRARSMDRRVVIVAGKSAEALQPTVDAAARAATDLVAAEFLLVPVVAGGGAPATTEDAAVQPAYMGMPVLGEQWDAVMLQELEEAQAQGAALDGPEPQAVVIILKKNGRIGQRRLTPPGGALPWDVLVRDVRNREDAGMDVTNI